MSSLDTRFEYDDERRATARRMWAVLEPYSATTFFGPESRQATDALGLRGGWMSYFGLRAAPMGEVTAAVVLATFYGFTPGRVGRAIPAAWEAASADQLLEARSAGVDASLRRLLGSAVESPEMAEAAELAWAAAAAAPKAGRPLGAANAALPAPEAAHLRLWLASTILRESRGDGHVAALGTAGLDGCECLVIFVADGRGTAELMRLARGWTEEEWAAAETRLRVRGLLDGAGALTAAGAALRRWVEDRTDDGITPAWEALGKDGVARLRELALPFVRSILDGGGFMTPNPIGLEPAEVSR